VWVITPLDLDTDKVEGSAPTVVTTSFFMDAARNESVRRATWDNTWSIMGLISRTYLTSVATIFEHNLGAPPNSRFIVHFVVAPHLLIGQRNQSVLGRDIQTLVDPFVVLV